MRFLRVMVILLLITIVHSTARAQQNVGAFEVTGCGMWSQSEQLRIAGIYWVQGFVSGYDYKGNPSEQRLRMVLPETVNASVSKYCAANPDKNILHAAENFVRELSTK
jgi:hypothetical protein